MNLHPEIADKFIVQIIPWMMMGLMIIGILMGLLTIYAVIRLIMMDFKKDERNK